MRQSKKKKAQGIPRDSVVIESKIDLGWFYHEAPKSSVMAPVTYELKERIFGAARFKKQQALNFLKENNLADELQLIPTRLVHNILAKRKELAGTKEAPTVDEKLEAVVEKAKNFKISKRPYIGRIGL